MKDISIEWTPTRLQAFNQLKEIMSTSPILTTLRYDIPNQVIMAVDTSYIAIGIALFQEDDNGKRRIYRYGSLPIVGTEAKYSQAKLELYGLYRALMHY